MCGIVGFWRPGGCGRDAESTLRSLTDQIIHRGPDDGGEWIDGQVGVALGFRRLAILDLTVEGHQPMQSASGRFGIVFNGEVYNFRDVRRELESAGARFRGHSDTEVILAAVERWGVVPAVQRLVGMFAIALWDRADHRLFLIRDRMGEKPLYYGFLGSTLVFGSELKALRKHPEWDRRVDRRALALFLRHGYVPAPHSIYEGVHKVRPGTMQVIDLRADRLQLAELTYWSPRGAAENGARSPLRGTPAEITEVLDRALRRTVRDEMVADVPLGAFLSGGVDSSLIVSLMQAQSSVPVKTFTIGFDEREFDEADFARSVARHLGTDHTELYVTANDALSVIPHLPAIYDEPFADSSQIPTFLVSQLASESVTVSLSGDGGDELFGGYGRYRATSQLWGRLGWVPATVRRGLGVGMRRVSVGRWDSLLRRIGGPPLPGMRGALTGDRVHKLAGILASPTREQLYRSVVSSWDEPRHILPGVAEHETILTAAEEWPEQKSFTDRMMWLDMVSYLPDDIMVKVDRASMAVSLEARAPLLDHRIVELAWSIPQSLKVRGATGKWILRRVLDRYVPRELIDRPKMGFGVPIGAWLRGPLRDWAESLLSRSRLERDGFFEPETIAEVWKEHSSGTRAWTSQLWTVLMFQAWLESQ